MGDAKEGSSGRGTGYSEALVINTCQDARGEVIESSCQRYLGSWTEIYYFTKFISLFLALILSFTNMTLRLCEASSSRKLLKYT